MASNANLTLHSGADEGFFCARSQAIQNINKIVQEIAGTDIPVLLMGESGTGKELYTRLIHRLSAQRHLPLKKFSCPMLDPAQLLSKLSSYRSEISELSVRGIGTLYLDAVHELDSACQKVLSSILADEETDGPHRFHARLLSSALPILEKRIESARFQKELFFRINGVGLRLPPLRERKEDIPELMKCLLSKHAAALQRRIPILSEEDVEILQRHTWPGNIRELGNLARRIVLLGDSERAIQELREMPSLESTHRDRPETLSLKAAARSASRRAERELIAKVLEQTHWNRKRAAQQLQISYKSLLYKIKQTGLEK